MIAFADGRRAGADGRKLIIGIRPEHVTLGGDLVLTIELVEPLGPETLVHGRLPDGQEMVVRLPGLPPGEENLSIALPADALHVFDAETGKRIEPIEQKALAPV